MLKYKSLMLTAIKENQKRDKTIKGGSDKNAFTRRTCNQEKYAWENRLSHERMHKDY